MVIKKQPLAELRVFEVFCTSPHLKKVNLPSDFCLYNDSTFSFFHSMKKVYVLSKGVVQSLFIWFEKDFSYLYNSNMPINFITRTRKHKYINRHKGQWIEVIIAFQICWNVLIKVYHDFRFSIFTWHFTHSITIMLFCLKKTV